MAEKHTVPEDDKLFTMLVDEICGEGQSPEEIAERIISRLKQKTAPEEFTKTIIFRLTKSMDEGLRDVAKRTDRSVSHLIRKYIREGMEKE